MDFNRLKYVSQLGTPTAILLSGVAVAAWVMEMMAPDAPVARLVATLLLVLLNGLCLMRLLYHSGITHYMENLPVVLYLWINTVFSPMHALWQSQIAILLLMVVVLFLHESYHDTSSQEKTMLGTLLILISSLFLHEFVWLIPIFWGALVYQQALTVRSFMASLIAIAFFSFYYAIACYSIDSVPAYQLIRPTEWFFRSSEISLVSMVEGVAVMILGLFFSFHLLWRLYREGNRTRFFICLYIAFLLLGGILTGLFSYDESGLSLMLYAFSLLATLYFQQKESTLRGVIFLLLFIGMFVAYFF